MDIAQPIKSENEQLIDEIALGNREAETQLVSKYYRPLLFILRQQTKDPSLVEDICQDSFFVVLRKARNREITNPDGLGAFVRSVGINLLIEFKRKATRQKTDTAEDFSHIEHAIGDDVESKVSKIQIVELISQILAEMPTARDRDILRMSFIEGTDKTTTCEALTLTPEHYDKVLYRAKQRLRQLMAMKLSLKDNKFRLIEIVTITLIFGLYSQFFDHQLRETSFQHHLLSDVQTNSRNLR